MLVDDECVAAAGGEVVMVDSDGCSAIKSFRISLGVEVGGIAAAAPRVERG